ncbi:MAG: type II toxin-antitoxin system antitoxin SocA domain-containing protein [Parcubacteria group bacterium]|jgi:transcriptional regulator with XRE-family HTH domain
MPKKLYEKIKKLRLKQGYSQDYLAKKLSLSRPTYMQIEKGERDITVTEAGLLAEIFGMTLVEFLSDTDVIDKTVVLEAEGDRKEKKNENEIRISVPVKNQKKFKTVLTYILKKVGGKPNIGMTAIYKLLYFIDFDYYEKYEEQLMGAVYIKNHFGPTPVMFAKIVEEMKAKNEIEEVRSKFYDRDQKKYFLNPDYQVDLTPLTAQEIKHIDWELRRLADKTAKELSDLSHEDMPWRAAEMGKPVEYNGVFYRDEKLSVREYDKL